LKAISLKSVFVVQIKLPYCFLNLNKNCTFYLKIKDMSLPQVDLEPLMKSRVCDPVKSMINLN
jgi:hypothetical protein